MTNWMRRTLIPTLCATAVAAAMTATPPVALAAGAGSTPVPHLDWQPCALPPGTTGPAGQECAILPVPSTTSGPADAPSPSLSRGCAATGRRTGAEPSW